MKKITNAKKIRDFLLTRKHITEVLALLAVAVLLVAVLVIFAPHVIRAASAPASPANDAVKSYDPIVMTLSDSFLQAGLIRNCQDAQAEYQLLRRAGYQHHEKVAYETMNRLRIEQPNNPVVLAGYFMALKMAEGGLNSMRYNGSYTALTVSHWDDDDAAALLQKAYRLAPKLWLTYAVDGEDKLYDPGGNHKQGLFLLQKAERLAPEVPYVHWLLEDAYTLTPISPEKYRMSVTEGKKALASGAPISNAAFILFQIYSLLMPNQAEEIKWKRKFYSLVPPDVKINPEAKKWLDRYPG